MDERSTRKTTPPAAAHHSRGVDTRLRARNIAARLFDEDAIIKIDRFVVLGRIGQGAMGAVYRAYDPSLDRAVALKVLHPDTAKFSSDAAANMHREAQALARLSHPHVVTIHEVGGADDQIWLAMEFVEGESLRGALDQLHDGARIETAIDLMLQAGDGLSAAHGAGVVHRDFKPANVLVGVDGRVRVADFGLARRVESVPDRHQKTDDELTLGVGTPAYMAPEQWDREVDARADQYAYCVVFWEALFGKRPNTLSDTVPTIPSDAPSRAQAIARMLLRGLQQDPADRYAGMDVLLTDIRDIVYAAPERHRRRRVATASALGLAGLAATLSWVIVRPAYDPCSGSAQLLEHRWAEASRASTWERFVEDATAYTAESIPRIRDGVEAFARDWVDAHHTNCLAHARQEVSDTMFDVRVSCLERAAAAFGALGEQAGRSDADLSGLVTATVALPSVTACRQLEPAPDNPVPPEGIAQDVKRVERLSAQSRTHLDAGDPMRALRVANEAVELAEHTGWDAAIAVARHERGRITTLSGPMPEYTLAKSFEDLDTATNIALRHRDDQLAIEAWARRAWIDGTGAGSLESIVAQSSLMTALAQGSSKPSSAEALLYNNLGGLHLGHGDTEQARLLFERSLEVTRTLEHPPAELEIARLNLALATENNTVRDQLFRALISRRSQALGPHHPQTVFARQLFAETTSDNAVAVSLLSKLAHDYDRLHPELVWLRHHVHSELGWLQLLSSERREAGSSFDAAASLATDEQAQRLANAFSLLCRGQVSAATALFQQITSSPDLDDPWNAADTAHATLGLALTSQDPAALRQSLLAVLSATELATAKIARRIGVACGGIFWSPPPELCTDARIAVEGWRAGTHGRTDLAAVIADQPATTASGSSTGN